MADFTETTATSTAKGKQLAVVEPKRSWSDEVDHEEEQPMASKEKAVLELNFNALAIDENKKLNKFLDDPEVSRIQAVTMGDTPYTSATTFEDLNLLPELLKGLYVEMKFQKPSKIQAITLPMILTPPFKDLIAQAHNGHGKTTCFVVGMLSCVDPKQRRPQALCIFPTRDLSIQNMEVLRKMGKYTGISSECVVPIESGNNDRSRCQPPISTQVLIGTPCTIKKLMSQKKLGVTDMKVLVFDEADHMLAKDGFQDDSLRIMKDIQRFNPHWQACHAIHIFISGFKVDFSNLNNQNSLSCSIIYIMNERKATKLHLVLE